MGEDEKVIIKEQQPAQTVSDFKRLQDYAQRPIRGKEQSIKSKQGSVTVRQDGAVSVSSGLYSQQKQNSILQQTEKIGIKEHSVSNQHMIVTDDFIVNKHKLNNKLYEFSDYKTVLQSSTLGQGGIVGKFMMFGTVLTKSWDHSLNKYVLVRRLAMMPIFSPEMNIGEVLPGLQITPVITNINDAKAKYMESGMDFETFIGKERPLTVGNKNTTSPTQTESASANTSGTSGIPKIISSGVSNNVPKVESDKKEENSEKSAVNNVFNAEEYAAKAKAWRDTLAVDRNAWEKYVQNNEGNIDKAKSAALNDIKAKYKQLKKDGADKELVKTYYDMYCDIVKSHYDTDKKAQKS